MWLMLESLLLMLGAALVVVEVMIIPGFGATGVVGGLMLAGGAYIGWTEVSQLGNVVAATVTFGTLIAAYKIAPRYIAPQTLVLDSNRASATAVPPELAQLVGWGGTTITPLRPAGTARIGGRTVDVVSSGMYVDAGQLVHVVRVEGARVVVEPTENRT